VIGKITIGKSFKGCLLYCINDKRQEQKNEPVMKERAEIIMFNQCYGSQQELIRQFNEVRRLNPKLSKPVLHITLNLVPGEQLSKDKLMEMCQDCAKDMGFENNQYVAIHHKDTKHQHLHIVANRIGFDKRTVSDSKNYQRIATYCRKMELKYQLKQVLSPRQFLPKDQRLIPRQDARKERLKKDIQQTLKLVRNYGEFEQKMRSLGYQVLKSRGISFIDNKKVKIKGSELGFSLMKIEKIFALKHEIETAKQIERNRKETEVQQQSKSMTKSFTTTERLMSKSNFSKEQEQSPAIELQKQLNDLIYQIIKPEDIPDRLAPEWLKKKRQKKRLGHHL
jgi:hypothetical protein